MRFVIVFWIMVLNCFGQEFNGLGDLGAGKVAVVAGGGAITIDAVTNWGYAGNANQTVSLTTSGSSRYLLVGVATAGIASPTGVTYNGANMSLVASTNNSDLTTLKLSVYGLVAPSSGTHDIVISISGAPSEWVFSACSWTGVNQSTPYSGTKTNQAINAASPTTLTISSATGEVVVDYATVYEAFLTIGGGQTQICNITQDGESSLGVSYQAGAATITPTWSYVGNKWWVAAAVSLKP